MAVDRENLHDKPGAERAEADIRLEPQADYVLKVDRLFSLKGRLKGSEAVRPAAAAQTLLMVDAGAVITAFSVLAVCVGAGGAPALVRWVAPIVALAGCLGIGLFRTRSGKPSLGNAPRRRANRQRGFRTPDADSSAEIAAPAPH